MKKKFMISITGLLVMVFLTACGPSYKVGTFEGEGDGYGGKIKVSVTVNEDGKMSAIEVLSHSDTPELANAAIERLKKNMLEKNSPDVDVITGATQTSEGLIQAVKISLGLE